MASRIRRLDQWSGPESEPNAEMDPRRAQAIREYSGPSRFTENVGEEQEAPPERGTIRAKRPRKPGIKKPSALQKRVQAARNSGNLLEGNPLRRRDVEPAVQPLPPTEAPVQTRLGGMPVYQSPPDSPLGGMVQEMNSRPRPVGSAVPLGRRIGSPGYGSTPPRMPIPRELGGAEVDVPAWGREVNAEGVTPPGNSYRPITASWHPGIGDVVVPHPTDPDKRVALNTKDSEGNPLEISSIVPKDLGGTVHRPMDTYPGPRALVERAPEPGFVANAADSLAEIQARYETHAALHDGALPAFDATKGDTEPLFLQQRRQNQAVARRPKSAQLATQEATQAASPLSLEQLGFKGPTLPPLNVRVVDEDGNLAVPRRFGATGKPWVPNVLRQHRSGYRTPDPLGISISLAHRDIPHRLNEDYVWVPGRLNPGIAKEGSGDVVLAPMDEEHMVRIKSESSPREGELSRPEDINEVVAALPSVSERLSDRLNPESRQAPEAYSPPTETPMTRFSLQPPRSPFAGVRDPLNRIYAQYEKAMPIGRNIPNSLHETLEAWTQHALDDEHATHDENGVKYHADVPEIPGESWDEHVAKVRENVRTALVERLMIHRRIAERAGFDPETARRAAVVTQGPRSLAAHGFGVDPVTGAIVIAPRKGRRGRRPESDKQLAEAASAISKKRPKAVQEMYPATVTKNRGEDPADTSAAELMDARTQDESTHQITDDTGEVISLSQFDQTREDPPKPELVGKTGERKDLEAEHVLQEYAEQEDMTPAEMGEPTDTRNKARASSSSADDDVRVDQGQSVSLFRVNPETGKVINDPLKDGRQTGAYAGASPEDIEKEFTGIQLTGSEAGSQKLFSDTVLAGAQGRQQDVRLRQAAAIFSDSRSADEFSNAQRARRRQEAKALEELGEPPELPERVKPVLGKRGKPLKKSVKEATEANKEAMHAYLAAMSAYEAEANPPESRLSGPEAYLQLDFSSSPSDTDSVRRENEARQAANRRSLTADQLSEVASQRARLQDSAGMVLVNVNERATQAAHNRAVEEYVAGIAEKHEHATTLARAKAIAKKNNGGRTPSRGQVDLAFSDIQREQAIALQQQQALEAAQREATKQAMKDGDIKVIELAPGGQETGLDKRRKNIADRREAAEALGTVSRWDRAQKALQELNAQRREEAAKAEGKPPAKKATAKKATAKKATAKKTPAKKTPAKSANKRATRPVGKGRRR